MRLRPLLVDTAVFLGLKWKLLFHLLSFQFMTQHNQKNNDLLMFELVDLLESLAISRYEQKIQNDFNEAMNPKPYVGWKVDLSANL